MQNNYINSKGEIDPDKMFLFTVNILLEKEGIESVQNEDDAIDRLNLLRSKKGQSPINNKNEAVEVINQFLKNNDLLPLETPAPSPVDQQAINEINQLARHKGLSEAKDVPQALELLNQLCVNNGLPKVKTINQAFLFIPTLRKKFNVASTLPSQPKPDPDRPPTVPVKKPVPLKLVWTGIGVVTVVAILVVIWLIFSYVTTPTSVAATPTSSPTSTPLPIGSLRKEFSFTKAVRSITFSPDGKYLAVGTADPLAEIWQVANLDKGETKCKFLAPEGHTDIVTQVAFSSDSKWLVTSSDDHRVILWEVESCHKLREFTNRSSALSVAFSPDNKLLAVGYKEESDKVAAIKIWDVNNNTQPMYDLIGQKGWVWTIAFSPNGKKLVSATNDFVKDSNLLIWDIPQNNSPTSATISINTPKPIKLSEDAVSIGACWSLAFSKDGKLAMGLLFVRSENVSEGVIRLMDLSGDEAKALPDLNKSSAGVKSVQFSQDGTTLVSASEAVLEWDIQNIQNTKLKLTLSQPNTPESHKQPINSVAISPDKKLIASGADDNTVKIWVAG